MAERPPSASERNHLPIPGFPGPAAPANDQSYARQHTCHRQCHPCRKRQPGPGISCKCFIALQRRKRYLMQSMTGPLLLLCRTCGKGCYCCFKHLCRC